MDKIEVTMTQMGIYTICLTLFFFGFVYVMLKIQQKKQKKLIIVPEEYNELWILIDQKHNDLRTHVNGKENNDIVSVMEQYCELVNKYKHKLYGKSNSQDRDNISPTEN